MAAPRKIRPRNARGRRGKWDAKIPTAKKPVKPGSIVIKTHKYITPKPK